MWIEMILIKYYLEFVTVAKAGLYFIPWILEMTWKITNSIFFSFFLQSWSSTLPYDFRDFKDKAYIHELQTTL